MFFVGLFLNMYDDFRLFEPASSGQITKAHPAPIIERSMLTAQRNQPQSSEARTCRSECGNRNQADRVGKERACRVSATRCVLKTKRRNRNLPGRNVYSVYNHKQAGGAWSICLYLFPISTRYSTLLSFSFVRIRMMHACGASGLFSWTMELLAFASRQFAPSICPNLIMVWYSLRSHCFVVLFPCERA